MKDHMQTIINVCLAVSITFLIYQNTQLKDRIETAEFFAQHSVDASWDRMDRMDKMEEKANANKSELQDCIDIGYKGVPEHERAWIETHERLFNQCTNYLSK